MTDTEEKRMYHLLIWQEATGREVPMEALAASEEAALEFIPAGFRFVRLLDRYYWPLTEEAAEPPAE